MTHGQTTEDSLENKPLQTPYGVFSQAQMRAALTRVEDKRDWKFPFDVVIPIDELPVLAAATEFFHGCELQAQRHPEGWRVQSLGYQG